jgi:hypothetical protein
MAFSGGFEGLAPVTRLANFISAAFEHAPKHKTDVGIVIDDQDAHRPVAALCHFCRRFARQFPKPLTGW